MTSVVSSAQNEVIGYGGRGCRKWMEASRGKTAPSPTVPAESGATLRRLGPRARALARQGCTPAPAQGQSPGAGPADAQGSSEGHVRDAAPVLASRMRGPVSFPPAPAAELWRVGWAWRCVREHSRDMAREPRLRSDLGGAGHSGTVLEWPGLCPRTHVPRWRHGTRTSSGTKCGSSRVRGVSGSRRFPPASEDPGPGLSRPGLAFPSGRFSGPRHPRFRGAWLGSLLPPSSAAAPRQAPHPQRPLPPDPHARARHGQWRTAPAPHCSFPKRPGERSSAPPEP